MRLFIFFFFFSLNLFSQDLPTEFKEGFKFPINSKFTIKLDASNPKDIKYSLIKFEQYNKEIDSWNTKDLFEKEGEEGTIDFYFCIGTYGKNDEERKQNMKVHLLFKNRTKLMLEYYSEIQMSENGEFEKTSNVGSFPGAIGNEMWPYMIYSIGLKDFKVMKE